MFEDRYTFGTRVRAPFGDVREAVIAALKVEGFGVLADIDVAATLQAKLGIEREPYQILGACNPPYAHQAITADPSVGALLPCNVVLRADGPDVVVEAMDPRAVLALVAKPEVEEIAVEIRARIVRMVESIASQFPATEMPA